MPRYVIICSLYDGKRLSVFICRLFLERFHSFDVDMMHC